MAFPILLQKNKSEKICLTKETTTILETSAVLKEETSIIDPTFIINVSIADINEVNYVTVVAFRRSYFVINVISITNDLVELVCHVDVLSSFASEIKANTGIVYRQENDWNLYLNDGVIQAYQNPIVTTQLFPKGFTESNYVLVCAGSRNIGGIEIGDGGTITVGEDGEAGIGGNASKTTSGLIDYCYAQLGKPYWMGTFGNTASADLLAANRRRLGEQYYPDPGVPAFTSQFGERVHDCVGLIKGYRWSDTPTSAPQYVVSEDVNVEGLYSQCTTRGNVDFSHTETAHLIGMCVFDSSLTHVGVYVGNGKIIEAQGHAYGIVMNEAYDRRGKFTLWGIPDWLKVTTPMDGGVSTVIEAQPQDTTVIAGNTAYMRVAASGFGLQYQWQVSMDGGSTWRNSGLASGRTNTWYSGTTLSMDGEVFRCMITDLWGRVIYSNTAILTVTSP